MITHQTTTSQFLKNYNKNLKETFDAIDAENRAGDIYRTRTTAQRERMLADYVPTARMGPEFVNRLQDIEY